MLLSDFPVNASSACVQLNPRSVCSMHEAYQIPELKGLGALLLVELLLVEGQRFSIIIERTIELMLSC